MIVVFGSSNIDIVAQVERHPHPGETALAKHSALFPGGKGANQAVAACCAGAPTIFVGCIGTDPLAGIALDSFDRSGVNTQYMQRDASHPTGCALITVSDAGENIIVVAGGANASLMAEHLPDALLSENTTLLLQMESPYDAIEQVIFRARKKGASIIFNCAPFYPISQKILQAIDYLVVNEHEYQQFEDHHTGLTSFRDTLIHDYGTNLVLTLGKNGVLYVDARTEISLPAFAVPVKDTTGAGDTFVGYFAALLRQGKTVENALRWASAAAALACTQAGAQSSIPEHGTVKTFLEGQ